MDKKGSVWSGLSAGGIISGLILMIVAFTVAAEILPDVETAADAINDTGMPFASFFVADGIILLAIMAGLVLAVLGVFGLMKSKR